MERYFQVDLQGCSISCKQICNPDAAIDQVVLFVHGFAGHRDNRAAARFAKSLCARHPGAAVVTFDLPCHGSDTREKLVLSDCLRYLEVMTAYLQAQYPAAVLDAYATSFGGYLLLKYIAAYENPFRRIALRCPAVNMYQVLCNRIMTEENRERLNRGECVEVGFDRKIPVDREFLNSLREADIMALDYAPFADRILILHGRKDEVVPFEAGEAFAMKNNLYFVPMAGTDHRFSDPGKMGEAIRRIEAYLAAD